MRSGKLLYFIALSKRLLKSKEAGGGVAHMVERSLRMREARGSIPRTSIFIFLTHL